MTRPVPSCPEDGKTFCENARAKAAHWHRHSGLACLADDSGLEVEVLAGEPSVRSARFAGEGASDRENNDMLLRKLEGVEEKRREARFVCCLALCGPDSEVTTFSGMVSGRILPRPAGRGGFGYDPVFFYPPLGRSFAQLTAGEKNEVSHRARALQSFLDYISRSGL
ncbi:MAG: non-canonical purine NTP pyrophosphatase [Gemmatimonadota bacterium]|nr:non-canonical purine NTP pyrophosphatase [Gemmatimonadota bacterium]